MNKEGKLQKEFLSETAEWWVKIISSYWCLIKGQMTFSRPWKWSESEVAQSCPTLCNPMDYSLPGSSVYGILQARVLECAIAFETFSRPKMELNSLYACLCAFRRRQWQPTPVLLPGESHRRRSLVGYSPWGRKESDTTERLHFHRWFLWAPSP